MPFCLSRTADTEARHWPVLLASFVASSLTHGLASSMGVFYIEWRGEFLVSSALVGWLSSSMLAMLLCFSPLAGALTKYFGVFWVVVAGGLLSFAGLLIASFTQEFYMLFITIPFMGGIGFGMSYTGLIVAISENFHKHYALANGITMTGASVGMAVLPVFFRFLIDQYGWRRALMVTSALQANVLVCAGVVRKHMSATRKQKNSLSHVTMVIAGAHQGTSHSTVHLRKAGNQSDVLASGNHLEGDVCNSASESLGSNTIGLVREYKCVAIEEDPNQSLDNGSSQRDSCLQRVLTFFDHSGLSLFWTNRVFSSYMVTIVPVSVIYGITLPYIVAQARLVGIPDIEASVLISVIGLSNILSRLTHGRLIDANIIQPAYIYVTFVALATVSAPIIAVVKSYTVLVICTMLIGLSAGAYIPMQAVLIRRIIGKERFPGGFGIGLVCVAVGNMTFSFIGGYLYDKTGSYSAAFNMMGVMSGLGVAMVLALHWLWTRLVPDTRFPVSH